MGSKEETVVSGTNCPDETEINNGGDSPSTGGGGISHGGQDTPDDTFWVCEAFMNTETSYDFVDTADGTPKCTFDTYSWISYENCGLETSLSANNSRDDACSKNDGDTPVIEPPKVILDPSLAEIPCAARVIHSFISSQTLRSPINAQNKDSYLQNMGITQDLLDFFDSSKDYNVSFKAGDAGVDNAGNPKNATTDYTRENNTAVITLDQAELANATDLSIARTVIHETMHAYIQIALYNFSLDPSIRESLNELYNELNPQSVGNNRSILEHEFISQYVDAMAYSLYSWDNNTNQRNLEMSYYKNLSWAGLRTSSEFNSLNNKNTIINNILSELNGTRDAKGSDCN